MNYFKEISTCFHSINGVFDQFKQQLGDYVPLGPSYSHLSYEDACRNLTRYRFDKYYSLALDRNNDRATNSVSSVLAYDEKGIKKFLPRDTSFFVNNRSSLHRIQREIEECLSEFRFKPENLRLPTGETSLSAKGDVSLLAKLRDVRQWCVTADCFDLAATIIYRVPGLKACARNHIGEISREERSCLYFAFSDYSDVGYRVFRELLLQVVTIVDGSRITTVPKDNDVDRVISCEPLLNMIVQSVIEEGIRECIKLRYNIDLDTAAATHYKRLVEADIATIDLSNASNSNWLDVVMSIYPRRVSRLLERSRSPNGSFHGNLHEWTMLSPMGNGFTFGVMTMTLLCALRTIDDTAMVFGDDIIVKQSLSSLATGLVEALGYQVNPTKSFTHGHFRESCGGFTSHGAYITSFKFTRAENTVQAFVNINKVRILADTYPMDKVWTELWDALVIHVPIPCLEAFDLNGVPAGTHVAFPNVKRLHRLQCKDKNFRLFRQRWLANASTKEFITRNQYVEQQLTPTLHVRDKVKTYRGRVKRDFVNRLWTQFFLSSGRVALPSVRCSLAAIQLSVHHAYCDAVIHSMDKS